MKFETAEIKVDGNAYRIEAKTAKASTFLRNQLATRTPWTILRNCRSRQSRVGDITVRQIN